MNEQIPNQSKFATGQAKIIIGVIVAVVIIAIGYLVYRKSSEPVSTEPAATKPVSEEVIKIGVITPLTGGVAYWGESSKLGVELAKKDLVKQGINVEFIIEDGQLDPKVALNAAQKLINIDRVDAIYSEFNPAAISVTSFIKDKDILHIYDAAPISPLKESNNIYKTYLDYEMSCQEVAQLIKNRGIEKVGILKINLEFGDLCLKGIKNVYGDNVFTESYNAGTTDFRTSISKLKTNNIQAIFNVSFQPETLTSIKNINELKTDVVFVGLSETVSPDIIDEYSNLLEGSVMFGLPNVSDNFTERIKKEFPNKTVSNYQAFALAYIHLKQIANALNKCDKSLECAKKEMDNVKVEPSIGFTGFRNHIAGFDTLIQEWKDGEFVPYEE